jgi:UDP-GlcNAc3NAcA epimerase
VSKFVRVITVVGARPQFIKAAAVSRAIAKHNRKFADRIIVEKIVHTGQHYDDNMSKAFFDELAIPRPQYNLEVGSGSHGEQTAKMLQRIEAVLIKEKPDWCLVYGDTNSTLAGALAAAKLHIPVAHVEAGLRSYNRRMPEEVNRVVADHVSALLFCPTDAAIQNLAKEGITEGVHQVGDVMYDSVLFNTKLAEQSSTIMQRLSLKGKSFYLATIHRAENTDDPERMNGILSALSQIDFPIVLPMHPRTHKILGKDLSEISGDIRVVEPVVYLDMLMLEKNARLILTDSGGVQKEAYWFNIPCITLRDETEWVETVDSGWNILAGTDKTAIIEAVTKAGRLKGITQKALYGQGDTADKICKILRSLQTGIDDKSIC